MNFDSFPFFLSQIKHDSSVLLVAKTAEGKEVVVLCQKTGEGLPILNCLSKTCLMRILIKTTLQHNVAIL